MLAAGFPGGNILSKWFGQTTNVRGGNMFRPI